MASMIRTRSTAPSARIARALPFVGRSIAATSLPAATLPAAILPTMIALAIFGSTATAQAPVQTPDGFDSAIAYSTAASFSVGGAQLGPTEGSFWLAFQDRLELHDGLGGSQFVVTLPTGHSTSLLQRTGSPERVYYGDFNADTIAVVDPGTLTQVDTLMAPPFSFSLDVTPAGDVLVAAASLNFADTEIHLLRPGQAPFLLGSFPNASGPIVVDPTTGDLFYALQPAAFPPPPGSVSIRRLPAATLQTAIAGGPMFSLTDTSIHASGIDGAFDMVLEDRGRLLVSDPNDGTVRAINANGSLGAVIALPNAPEASLSLDFRDSGTGTLDPYQAGSGSELLVQTTLFGAFATVQFVEPLQPILDATNGTTLARGVDYGLVASGLPANGLAFFTIGFQTQPGLIPQLFATAPNGAPILSVLDFAVLPPITIPLMVDGSGFATLSAPNATPATLAITVEVFAVDPGLTTVAVSTPVQMTLLP